ncbi:MAG: hypothetical protein R2748_02925 [Bryobacterales bacterium]
MDQNYYTTKVDHVLSDNDRLNTRFVWAQAPEVIPAVFRTAFSDPRAGTRSNRHWNTTTSWMHNFSPTVINEFRFNWGDRCTSTARRRLPNANAEFGFRA